MSKVKMLLPAEGINGIEDFVVNTIKEAGGRACPPLIVGVGIGGDLEKCALLAKEALLRDINDSSNDEDAKILEKNLTLALTNEKNGNILTYPTEMAILYAISDLVLITLLSSLPIT